MKIIPAHDWDSVREIACEIANAAGDEDSALMESRTAALLALLAELEKKYGACSRITATIADYTEFGRKELYEAALSQAIEEGDAENEAMIRESLEGIRNEK